MKTLFLTFGFVLLLTGIGYSQTSFTITGKLGSTAEVTLTAPVAAVMRAVVDDANRRNDCDMVAKTCPRGGAFHTVQSYLTDRVNEVFSSYEKQVLEAGRILACKTWKTLSAVDQDTIKQKLGGAPCE